MTKRIQNYSETHLVGGLLFNVLRHANLGRVERFKHTLDGWTPAMWACAAAGEMGELCNLIKKQFRGDPGITKQMIADEIADVVIYLDLLAARLNISLGAAVAHKWNESSKKRKHPFRISHDSPLSASARECDK